MNLPESIKVSKITDDCLETNSISSNAVFKFCLKNKIKLVYSAVFNTRQQGFFESKFISICILSKSKNLELLNNLRIWFKFKFEVIYFYNVYSEGQIFKR